MAIPTNGTHAYVVSIAYTHCRDSHTHTHLSDALILGLSTVSTFLWPYLTERAQLLLISWVTRHSRWASALGWVGTAADVVEAGGEREA